MTAIAPDIESLSLSITEEILVRSSLSATFAALLEEMGPSNEGHNGAPMPMILEPWPGGRWFRDLGNNNGHLWGHVQAIKHPTCCSRSQDHSKPEDLDRSIPFLRAPRRFEICCGTPSCGIQIVPPPYRDARYKPPTSTPRNAGMASAGAEIREQRNESGRGRLRNRSHWSIVRHQPKVLAAFEPVDGENRSIRREHGRAIELFGQRDERGVRKIHRKIGIRVEQLPAALQ